MLNYLKKRTSVRTYSDVELSEEDYLYLKEYIENPQNLIGPFGTSIKLDLLNTLEENINLGTYGVIKGANLYLVATSENSIKGMYDSGFILEDLFLKLANKGIGTCFMAGTYRKETIKTHYPVNDDEVIAVISPIGYPAKKTSTTDKLVRFLAKGNNRREYKEIFFDQTLEPLVTKTKELEFVQVAPSASNKQPWRLIVNNDLVDFNIQRTKGYGDKLNYDIQAFDIGIALRHYTLESRDFQITYSGKTLPECDYLFSIEI